MVHAGCKFSYKENLRFRALMGKSTVKNLSPVSGNPKPVLGNPNPVLGAGVKQRKSLLLVGLFLRYSHEQPYELRARSFHG